jgi:CheY-like chemotaxis protein
MPATLLVVDDSKSSRRVNVALVRDLFGEQVACLEAASGEEALAVLAGRQIDLVLLDLTMPGISGYDVLAELRKRHSTVPVVVVSADIQKLAKARVAALGAIGFIEKPVRAEALRTVLTTLGVAHG